MLGLELFDIEIESLRWFSTLHRALARRGAARRDRSRRRSAHTPRAGGDRRVEDEELPHVAELLPVDRFRELLSLLPEHTDVVIAADEDLEPALRDHWDDCEPRGRR